MRGSERLTALALLLLSAAAAVALEPEAATRLVALLALLGAVLALAPGLRQWLAGRAPGP